MTSFDNPGLYYQVSLFRLLIFSVKSPPCRGMGVAMARARSYGKVHTLAASGGFRKHSVAFVRLRLAVQITGSLADGTRE